MRRPKGNKTRKAVAKRFKITGTLLQTKEPGRRRSLGKVVLVARPTPIASNGICRSTTKRISPNSSAYARQTAFIQ